MPQKRTVKVKRITCEETIPYEWMDRVADGSNLGRAEFVFCPLWRKGKMNALLIYPMQQRNVSFYYRLSLRGVGSIDTFRFASDVGLEDPRPWRMFWCDEHETVSFEVYVPSHTNRLSFHPYFGNSIDIRFERKGVGHA